MRQAQIDAQPDAELLRDAVIAAELPTQRLAEAVQRAAGRPQGPTAEDVVEVRVLLELVRGQLGVFGGWGALRLQPAA